MAKTYEVFTRFRPEATEREERLVREALEADRRIRRREDFKPGVGPYGEMTYLKGNVYEPLPSLKTHRKIGLERARKQFELWDREGEIYPDVPDIQEKFPGTDPRGNYCEVDMGFQDRLEKIKAAMSSRPWAIQGYLSIQLFNLEDKDSRINDYWQGMKESCEDIRDRYRGAKLAMTASSAKMLQSEAVSIAREDKDILRVNAFLNVLEYVSGLSDRKPTRGERDFMYRITNVRVSEIERSMGDPNMEPLKIEMPFADFDHQVRQKFFASPKSWGKGPAEAPQDAIQEATQDATKVNATMKKMLALYSAATADRVLSPLFDKVERDTFGCVNRGDLLIVDGRLASDMMRDRFREELKDGTVGKDMTWQQWNEKRGRQACNEIVSAALMADKRVEVFVPNQEGKIPKEPVQITKTGYKPSPIKKVTLNAWERHFAKHGFYKEKAAKAVEYERISQARERVQQKNHYAREVGMIDGAGRYMKNMFFREWEKENGPIPHTMPGGFSTGRSALTSITVCAMLNEGYTIPQILDPGQLAEEKQKIGSQTADRMKEHDREWIARTCYEGSKALIREMNTLGEDKTLDIGDLGQLFSSRGRNLRFAAQVSGDLWQEISHVEEAFQAAAEQDTPGRGKETVDRLFSTADSVSAYMDAAEKALIAPMQYEEGKRKNPVLNVARWEYARNLFAQRMQERPDAQITELGKSLEFLGVSDALSTSRKVQKGLFERMETDKTYAAVIGSALRAGELGKHMQISYDLNTGNAGLQIASEQELKEGIKQEMRAEQLREAVRKNVEKEAKKKAKEAEPTAETMAEPKAEPTAEPKAETKAEPKAEKAKAPGRRR